MTDIDCEPLRDELLDVLYGEATPEAYARVHQHLSRCQSCREEASSLRRLRRTLGEWRLPETPPPASRLRRWSPPLLAAAAMLAVCAGAALGLSGSEVSFREGRLAFRLGRGPDVERLLAEQRQHYEQALSQLASSTGQSHTDPEEELLRRVEERLRNSEARQAVLLAAGLAELSEQTETQRRYDLARVSASLSYLEGRQGRQLARASEAMGYMLQAAEKRVP